jgi:uncharacterized membrane protein YgcG
LIAAISAGILLFAGGRAVAVDDRDFPLPQGLVTDLTGTLSTIQLEAIGNSIRTANEATGLDGRVVIASSTDEWYLDEYVKDYGDYLQSQNVIGPTGWVLYISVDDRKFALAVQDGAYATFAPARLKEIKLMLDEKLETGDLNGAVTEAVKAIGDLPALHKNQPRKGWSPNTLVFMGIAVILFTIMIRSRRQARSSTIAGRG